MIKRNQPLRRVLRKGNNGTAGRKYSSTNAVMCSLPSCTEEALIVFNPPLCLEHWEIALLVEGARSAGLGVTVQSLMHVKRSSAHLVAWKVDDSDVPALLKSYQAAQAVPA